MPLQILNVPNPNADIGRAIGTGIGSGLSNVIDKYTQTKLNQLTARSQENKLTSAYEGLGYSKEEARSIASLPEKAQIQFLKEYGPRSQQQEEQPQNFMEELKNLEQPAQQINHEGILGALTALQPQNLQQDIAVKQAEQFLTPEQNQEAAQKFIEQYLTKRQATQPQVAPAQKPIVEALKEKVAPAKPAVPERRLTKTEELARRKEEQALAKEERVRAHEEEKRIQTETKPYFDKIEADKDFATFSEPRLKKFENLIKKGGLPISGLYNLFKTSEHLHGYLGAIAAPISSLLQSAQKVTSPNTDEFVKLSNEFVRGAKEIFGNRITDADLNVFLSMIPSLSQTDSGKLAIINNMRQFNKAAEVRYKNMEKIIKENGGKRPQNLRSLVDEMSKDEIDKIFDDFQNPTELADANPALKTFMMSQNNPGTFGQIVGPLAPKNKNKGNASIPESHL